VALEPFIQFNHNAYVHTTPTPSVAPPQRFRSLAADFEGNVAELLSKAIDQKSLDTKLTAEDQDKFKEALRTWGMLDEDMKYAQETCGPRATAVSNCRPAGGVKRRPRSPPTCFPLNEVVKSGIAANMAFLHERRVSRPPCFQPVGGHGT
jgi:monoamine oxidase